jgi:hypothetical protein
VFCRKQSATLTKLGERSERWCLVGCEPSTKGHRVLLESCAVVILRNCIFIKAGAADSGLSDDDAGSDSDSETNEAAQ